MYIKQVIIQGFRSYRDQTVIEPFSPKHNVVVGRNGSGKSNFFLAIQFVLSDEFTNMRQEERQQLLHEGTGPRVVSSYVEIVFDNTDNRIPIDKDEITLRRVIGSKKDQYFLEKKNVTKTDVMNLFESAGFSRSNPYYIVKQGRINQLAIAKDHERLKLLREVAGTRVYDERKIESQNILKETESKRSKINEFLEYIEERLGTLQTEKEELKQYQKWDKDKRCLEYTIHDKDLREAREKLDALDADRENESTRASELHEAIQEAADKVQEYEGQIRQHSDECSTAKLEKDQLDSEHQGLVKTRTKLELEIKDLEDAVREDAGTRHQSAKELDKLEKTIEKKEAELAEILPSFKEKVQAEKEADLRLKSCEQRRTDLFSKQGRTNQFRTKVERDKWLKKQIKDVTAVINNRESQIAKTMNSTSDTRKRLEQLEKEITERSENLEVRRAQMDQSNKDATELKRTRDELTNNRKELWRKENTIDTNMQKVRAELTKNERDLRSTMSKAVANGVESVRQIQAEKQLEGVFGPVIENFECDDKFFTSVEVTAGNKLFNIIVDTDKTGTHLLQIMNKMKLPGEVSLMPLNKLQFRDVKYPESKDAIPMLHKVQYDERFKPAMQLCFGKTLICRNQDFASQFSKGHDLDCITLEGDQFSRKGTLTGGFYESRRSRLTLQKGMWESNRQLAELETEHEQVKSDLADLDAQITKVLAEIEKIKTTQEQLKQTYEHQKQDVKNLTKEKLAAEQSLGPKEAQLGDSQTELQTLKNQLNSFQDELGSELLSQLSAEDQTEVEALNEEIVELKERLKTLMKERTQFESQKQALDDLLTSNLHMKRDELKNSLEEVDMGDKEQRLDSKKTDLNDFNANVEKSSKRVKELDAAMKERKKEMKALQKTLEQWEAALREKKGAVEDDAKLMEKLANKKSLLLKKKEECMKNIRELGSLPADAFEKYQKTATKQLWRKLNEATEELKKYSHVNKKALDQFVSFTEQKEKLIKRKDEIDAGHESILDLMDVLEERKHEAILFTFKQVSTNFAEIFKKLVPGGRASLKMKKEIVSAADAAAAAAVEDEEGSSSQPSSETSSQRAMKVYDQYSGVSITVSFSGKSAETLEMNQLSGGQKTLVAMTLIFAIQKCDPAPFYLFDEIDQALDPVYRSSVAGMIHELSANAQFITTTFRPELLESAEKFYGVQFKNKVSHILSITKDEAKDFVIDDETEEQNSQPPTAHET